MMALIAGKPAPTEASPYLAPVGAALAGDGPRSGPNIQMTTLGR